MVVDPPGPRSRAILARAARVLYPGLARHQAPFVTARKSGYLIEDVDGNVYLDFLSGMASVPFGAGVPEIIEPAVDALRTFGNEDGHYFATSAMVELAEMLLGVAPAGLTRVDIALNGTEAVEIAVRFMRRATGRPMSLSFMGGYHGESGTTASLGAEAADIARGVRHLNSGIVHVPYPNPYRTPFSAPRAGGSGDSTVDYIRDFVLFHVVDPADVAGILIEPMLGSGGVISPPAGFWPALKDLASEHGFLLCLDEVKTGFGRTGEFFAAQRFGIVPDLMALGKAMGGGAMPIGAVLGTERAMGSFDDVSTGSTWSWLPAACAAARATISVMREDGRIDHVRRLEAVAREELEPLKDRIPAVGDIRVLGCFIGIELVLDRQTKERDGELQAALARECVRRGVLGDPSTTSFNLQPSLVMPEAALRAGLRIVCDVLAELTSERAAVVARRSIGV
jgi:4-aminobutyrate aminotransferase-like enzyme